eukprot:TRINITY_DN64136_c0_g1_i1.p2 TRINITY_DN64136_c0_g1~~TRINITY_DN64136_c0_g1_i1.p2  ORF type:complete len:209 (+),score=69.75 TRINITY_DN64136_c0_g1_i1:80-628(+)
MAPILTRLVAGAALLAPGALALSACDNEAGQVCPMSIGKEIGECLQDPSKHQITDIDGNPRELEEGEKPLELSAECKDFIKINKECEAEIEEHCQGQFYHGDTMTCLTQWAPQDALGAGCKDLLPKKEEKEEEVDKEKEAWRAKRKAARAQAQKDIEKEKAQKDGSKKRRRRRKAKKSGSEL